MLYDLLFNKLFYSADNESYAKEFKVIEQNLSPWIKNFYQPFVIEHIKPEKNLSGLRMRSDDFLEVRPWHMSGRIYEGERREGFFKYRPFRYAVFDYSFAGMGKADFDTEYPRIYKNKTAVFMDLMSRLGKSLIMTSEMFLKAQDFSLSESTKLCQEMRPAANPLWALHSVEQPCMIQTADINTVNYAFYLTGDQIVKKSLFCKNMRAYNTKVLGLREQKDFLSVSSDADWKLLLYDAADLVIDDKEYKNQFSADNFAHDKNTLFIGKDLIRLLHEATAQSQRRICSHKAQQSPCQNRQTSLPEDPKNRHRLVPSFMIENWARREGMIKD